jgi:succinyl-diaminopimelate desuccinylase
MSTKSSLGVADRLARRALELVDISSVSRHEEDIARHIASCFDETSLSLELEYDNCLYLTPTRRPSTPFVVFAGHLDTVPPQDNFPGRIENGFVLGLGSCDMKGGLAVMIELANWIESQDGGQALDAGFLFFGREELTFDESPISGVLERVPEIKDADLIVVMEPTANELQLGCLGNLNADVIFTGSTAHSARPWLGDNAITTAVRALSDLAHFRPREVIVGGLPFVEVVTITGIEGGRARNVIPDLVTCHVNMRYAPEREPHEAEEELRALAGPQSEVLIIGNAPPGGVSTDNHLIASLRAAGGARVTPKQAWTNVGEFYTYGLDAVNFGPGKPELAHTRDERVEVQSLVRALSDLQAFLSEPAR